MDEESNSDPLDIGESAEQISPTTSKRRRNLTVSTKAKIIERLQTGESIKDLAKEYNTGVSTVWQIKKSEKDIMSYAKNESGKNRKTLKSPYNTKLEKALYTWYMQRKNQGESITGPMLQNKALEINEQLGGSPDFKASNGWLYKFRQRHGNLEEVKPGNQDEITEEQSWPDGTTVKLKFQSLLTQYNYQAECIYNADETGILWKSLPTKTVAAQQNCFSNNDRLTLLVASNAAGTHRLPLFIIGKLEPHKCFNDKASRPPIVYQQHREAWMDPNLFAKWYTTHFIPEVKKYQNETGSVNKVLLLVDYSPPHSQINDLNSIDSNFRVLCFPPNDDLVTLFQPMEQGIIKKFKRLYRKQLLRTLFRTAENADGVMQFLKKVDLKDFCFMAAFAWDMLTEQDLINGWQKLWPELIQPNVKETDFIKESVEIYTLLKNIPGCNESDEINTLEWLDVDKNNLGYASESDLKLLETTEPQDSEPTLSEVLPALQVIINWTEKNMDSDKSILLALNKIRDKALKNLKNEDNYDSEYF